MIKKILIIINNLGIGGAERLVVDDINEMTSMSLDITLITLKQEPRESFYGELRLKKGKVFCLPFKGFSDIRAWFRLIRLIRELNPDLVVTHLWFTNVVGRVGAKLAGVSNIISFEHNVYDSLKSKKMFLLDKLLSPLSRKIIAVSEAVKQSLVHHGINKKRIEVILNGIDLSRFQFTGRNLSIRKELGIPDEAFVFIFIGRLIRQKGVDILLEALRNISGAYLLLVGGGVERHTLEEQCLSLGLRERIIFLGRRLDAAELIKASDCFVLPSRYEGLPMVLVEALASGIAIVVTDFHSAREVIEDETNGLIVPRENPDALTKAMARLMNDKDLRDKLSFNAKISRERFSITSHAHAILRYVNDRQAPWQKYLHNIRKRETEIVFSLLSKKHFDSGLEIGAGDGFQTTLLSSRVDKLISSDLNFKRIKESLRVPLVEYKQIDADEMEGSFPKESFDLVFSSNVLEHVRDPKKVLSATLPMLKDDGTAIHIVPSRAIKISYLLFYYPNLFLLAIDRLVGVFNGKKFFQGAKIDLENNINLAVSPPSGRFRKFLFPSIHGNFRSHREEFVAYSKRRWGKIFIEAGYSIVSYAKGPAFSGYGFGLSFFRKILESLGVSSEHIFILKKRF